MRRLSPWTIPTRPGTAPSVGNWPPPWATRGGPWWCRADFAPAGFPSDRPCGWPPWPSVAAPWKRPAGPGCPCGSPTTPTTNPRMSSARTWPGSSGFRMPCSRASIPPGPSGRSKPGSATSATAGPCWRPGWFFPTAARIWSICAGCCQTNGCPTWCRALTRTFSRLTARLAGPYAMPGA